MTALAATSIRTKRRSQSTSAPLQRWGAAAAFLLAVSFLAANWIYLTGNLDQPLGPLTYSLADLLYGPVWAASLVTMFLALREHIGARAERRMNLALVVAVLAAAAMLAVALIRSANRTYFLAHPELQLQSMSSVMTVWTTLVAGVMSTGFHLLGWAFILGGWAGYTSQRLPRVLSWLYVAIGTASLFVYLLPENEGLAILGAVVIGIWQGILFLRPSKP